MGYRDDFYTKDNIIGYTGDLTDNPTVYFKNGSEWARITQHHDNQKNIGRAFVRNQTYEIKNEVIKGKEVAVEYVNGSKHHQSRNKFLPVSEDNRGTLGVAIKAFHHIRPRHEPYVRDGVDLTNEQYADYFEDSDWTAT